MDRKIAKQIGQRLAIKSALIGLTIAYLLFGYITYGWSPQFFKAFFWIVDVEFLFHLLVGAFGLLAMAYFFGQLAGIDILIKKKNDLLTGIKYGILTLITGTLIGSTVGFIQEGIDEIGGFSNPFFDYYFKPLYWITMLGIIPVLIVGIWFGRQTKKQGMNRNADIS